MKNKTYDRRQVWMIIQLINFQKILITTTETLHCDSASKI